MKAFKKFFGSGEDKGLDCEISSDGEGRVGASCKRTKRLNDGSEVHDGQEFNITADPSNDCVPSYTGHLNVRDEEWKATDDVSKRLARSCKRMSQKGIQPKPQ